MQALLQTPSVRVGAIWYPQEALEDQRAHERWSPDARRNAIDAAAATDSADPFAKYPQWILPHFADVAGVYLDAGCGYGRVSIPLLESNPRLRCVGIDGSPEMLQRFDTLSEQRGVASRVELFCGNINTLPLADGVVDAVMSCAVLLHQPTRDVPAVLREFHRVLKPGGKLILAGSFPNVFNLEGVQLTPNWLRRQSNGPVRVYTRRWVRHALADFKSVQILGNSLVVLPRQIGKFPLPGGRMIRSLNQRLTQSCLGWIAPTGLFTSHHDVVAIK